MSEPSTGNVNNTQTVAKNSFWFGLETAAGIVSTLLVSIIAANVIGMKRLGPYIEVGVVTNVSVGVGASGLAITTRKYMSEYLNRGEFGIAKAVYAFALRMQGLISVALVAVGLPLAYLLARPGYGIVTAILVINMAPRTIVGIPSMANMGGERMRWNTGPSLVGGLLTVVLTLFSLWIGWGLVGVSSSFLAGCTLEVGLKMASVRRWLAPFPKGTISHELKKRMMSYSGQGLVLMLLTFIVWDRSDIVILGWMNPDQAQKTLFGIAFTYTDKLLTIPNTFAGSLGATIMAQFGRGAERVREMVVEGARYGFLMAVPLLIGMACVSRQFITLFYKPEYQAMIPVLIVASLLAIPKAVSSGSSAPTVYLQTIERQDVLIWIGCICGAVDFGLDFLLTGHYGAMGATVANGSAQALAAVLLWTWICRHEKADLRLGAFARIALAGAGMAAAVLLVQYLLPLPRIPGLAVSIATGALSWLMLLRLTKAITPVDGERIRHIAKRLPGPGRSGLERCLNLMGVA